MLAKILFLMLESVDYNRKKKQHENKFCVIKCFDPGIRVASRPSDQLGSQRGECIFLRCWRGDQNKGFGNAGAASHWLSSRGHHTDGDLFERLKEYFVFKYMYALF